MAKDKKKNEQSPEEILEETAETTETEEDTQVSEEENKSEKKIAELEKEVAAAKEAHIRTLAEYDNFRKRTAKEKEAIYTDAKAVCMTELLPVLDNFDRALSVTDSDVESYKKGMEMVNASFLEILKKLGVESFGEKGETFDPNFHNGVMHVDDEEMEENVIAEVFSKGYKIGDKVLRPAMVKVAN